MICLNTSTYNNISFRLELKLQCKRNLRTKNTSVILGANARKRGY